MVGRVLPIIFVSSLCSIQTFLLQQAGTKSIPLLPNEIQGRDKADQESKKLHTACKPFTRTQQYHLQILGVNSPEDQFQDLYATYFRVGAYHLTLLNFFAITLQRPAPQ